MDVRDRVRCSLFTENSKNVLKYLVHFKENSILHVKHLIHVKYYKMVSNNSTSNTSNYNII